MEEAEGSLYQRVLGRSFARLPPVLRAFHSLRQGAQAQGVVNVRYGRGRVRRAFAKALRLPPEGERITVQLQVQPQNGREIWVRQFDNLRMETLQWQRGDLLIEKAGALCFAFYVDVHEEGLRFQFVHNEIAGFKLPLRLLQVEAKASATELNANGWFIQVTISAPLVGLLAEYRGEISPC